LIIVISIAPDDSVVQQVFKAMGSAPLYQKLCNSQQSFRARLNPKPWRSDLKRPNVRRPFTDSRYERQFDAWEQEYKRVSEEYRVCQHLTDFGSQPIHPDLEKLVSEHDELTGVDKELTLA